MCDAAWQSKRKRQPRLPYRRVTFNSGRRALAILLAETLDSTGGIHDLLLAGVERVARRTDLDVQWLAVRRLGLERVAAAASHFDFLVFRVDAFFHGRVCPLFTTYVGPVDVADREKEARIIPEKR
jgi:hypothetical protein